jgi:hypothetical protein
MSIVIAGASSLCPAMVVLMLGVRIGATDAIRCRNAGRGKNRLWSGGAQENQSIRQSSLRRHDEREGALTQETASLESGNSGGCAKV